VINGTKVFISGAGETDVLVVMLRTGGDGPKGITAVLVPADAAGISYGKKEEKMGWNAQPTRMVSFDNVRVPVAHRLGEEGQGFAIAMEGLDGGRINIATCSVGTAQQALEEARDYVGERRQFGAAIGDFQATQFRLADMLTDVVAARQMVRLAASRLMRRTRRRRPTVPWPSALPRTRVFVSATRRCSCSAAMAISANTRWSGTCATRACTRFSRARTKSCA
jgi:alkylation response protein AidB-like acyl-CoA dehydrogenase